MENRHETALSIIDFFMLSNLTFIEFINYKLHNTNTFEKQKSYISALKLFLKDKEYETLIEDFYNNQLRNIKVDTSQIKFSKKSIEFIEEVHSLQEDVFEQKSLEISSLTEKHLDKILKSFQEGKIINPYNEGLNYNTTKTIKGKLEDFRHELIDSKLIKEINNKEFSKFFKETYKPNNHKIVWTGKLYELSYLWDKIIEDKINFKIKEKGFRAYIPQIFMFENEKTKIPEIVEENRLSKNGLKKGNPDRINKTFKLLS